MNFKYGCDPEMFLKLGDKFVPACGLFPGTKDEPFKLDKGAVQVDGLALEFNIDAVETVEAWVENIATVLAQVDEMIQSVDKNLTRVFVPFARFDPKDLVNLTEDQKRLGCDPDYNGLTGKINPRPEIQDEPFRTAAGHIHIGWTDGADIADAAHFEDCRYLSQLHYHGGSFLPHNDDEHRRLKYYGAYGAFRPKPYGVEIRFPSNRWLTSEYNQRNAFNSVNNLMKRLANKAAA